MKAARRAVIVLACATLLALVIAPYWTAAAMILRAADAPGWIGRVARWNAKAVTGSIAHIPARGGAIRARLFTPATPARRAVVLVTGVHPDGIDEPRLVELANDLAATGVNVITPEIPDLMGYRLTAAVTNAIEDAALWTAGRRDLSAASLVGIIGVSFSGGLSIVAAGRPALRDHVAFVMSIGGHGNLPRVLRYLCTGQSPRPHDYAVAIVLHESAGLLVPPEQVVPLRTAIEAFLSASAAARSDQAHASDMTQAARLMQGSLPEPAATLMKHVIDRDVAALGASLRTVIDQLAQDPSLSPDRSPAPAAPVYLLHGRDDRVIPAVESAQLAAYLEPKTRVRRLESGFLSHVDIADRPSAREVWQMVAFWKAALGERGTH